MACDGGGCPCESGAAHDSGELAPLGRRVLTIGTFDLFHLGHLKLLERAARLGRLHVGVNSDEFVQQYKGLSPRIDEDARKRIVSGLKCVHRAWLNDDRGRTLIDWIRPDFLVVGSDWHERDYTSQIGVSQSELDQWGVGVLYLPRTAGVSSTELRGH